MTTTALVSLSPSSISISILSTVSLKATRNDNQENQGFSPFNSSYSLACHVNLFHLFFQETNPWRLCRLNRVSLLKTIELTLSVKEQATLLTSYPLTYLDMKIKVKKIPGSTANKKWKFQYLLPKTSTKLTIISNW